MTYSEYECTEICCNQFMGMECKQVKDGRTTIFFFDKLGLIKKGDKVKIGKDDSYHTREVWVNGKLVCEDYYSKVYA